MQFAIIRPLTRQIELANCNDDYKEAVKLAGLDPNSLDHGTLARGHLYGIGIWVFEWGLMQPKEDAYFAIGRQMFNGTAVLYAFDERGETTDVLKAVKSVEHLQTHVIWLGSAQQADCAITDGHIDRPQSSINGYVTWEWKP